MRVRSNGSKTSSTFGRPARGRPRRCCRAAPTVAVLVTVRHSDQRNASQQLRVSAPAARGDQTALDRRLLGLAVHPAVVDLFDPGGEQGVQLGHVVHASRPGADLDQELVPHGAEELFDLAPTGRLAGALWMSWMPSTAQARCSCLSIIALPLSKYRGSGIAAGGEADAQRAFQPTVSSRRAHR